MAGRRVTTYDTADMSISMMANDDPEDVTSVSVRRSAMRSTVWVNPNATMIGADRPTHEASWLHGPENESFMEQVGECSLPMIAIL